MADLRRRTRRVVRVPVKFRSLLPALIVLLVALMATGLSVWGQRNALIASERVRFAIEGDGVIDNVGDVMTAYVSVMKAGVGLFYASSEVTAQEWRAFIAALELEQDFPGIQGIGFSEVQRKSAADGGTLPGESGDMETSIRFLAPDNERNARAMGFDMYSEATRREAMARARDTGQPVITAAVTLVQETGDNPQPGVLIYMPLYRDGVLPPDAASRRRELRGFVYSAFRMTDLMSKSLAKRSPEMLRAMRLRVYDGPVAAPQQLLFDSFSLLGADERRAEEVKRALFSTSQELQIAGRSWTAELISRPEFERKVDWTRLFVQLAGGIVISVLMAAIVAGLALARARSQEAAAKLSDEVEDRRRAQEQAHLANRELIHRVKNTLAIVNAIASQTARHTRNMNEFMRAFRERLSALGRVHDLLRPDRAGNPDFRGLLGDTLAAYKPDTEGSLLLDGPDVPVARDDAVLLSLFINELATNALKYGAWSVPRGRISIRWRLEKDADQGEHLVVVWKEQNGPLVAAPSHTGFGTNVMRFAVERSLGGTVTLNYPDTGAEHEIRLPWGNAVDPAAPYGQIPNKAM